MIFASLEKKVLPLTKQEKQRTHSLQHTPHRKQAQGHQRFDEKRYDVDAEEDRTEGDVDPCPCSYVTLEEENNSKTIVDKAGCQRCTDS